MTACLTNRSLSAAVRRVNVQPQKRRLTCVFHQHSRLGFPVTFLFLFVFDQLPGNVNRTVISPVTYTYTLQGQHNSGDSLAIIVFPQA